MRFTRAFRSSCCALRTSRVVRCPTLASSRTPVNATSAACTCACAAMICAFEASSVPQPGDNGGAHLVAVGRDLDPPLADGLFGLTNARVDLAALVDRDRKAGHG